MEAKKKRGKPIEDLELAAYALQIGPQAYKKEYTRLYNQPRFKSSSYTGRTAPKSKEELEAIKHKYQNGVTKNHIKEMLGIEGEEA